MVINGVTFPMDRIAEICRKYEAVRLSLFGSILREPGPEGSDGFRPSSDIDMLVFFAPGKTPSLLRFAEMQMELERAVGREVQLSTPPMLSKYFRHRVLSEAQVLHAA